MNRTAVIAVASASLALVLEACNAPRSSPASTVASEARTPTTAAPPATAEPTSPTPSAASSGAAASTRARTFDDDSVDSPPAGFSFGRTGGGPLGRWVVRSESGAPSGANVLAQLDTDDTDYRFPVAVMSEPVLRDVRVGVRCKPVSGRVDQACGLVARYRDENNYIVTRANALEDNVRLYVVRDGQRHQLASWSGAVTSGAWHEYQLDARGDHLEVYWDGTRVIDHHDSTFTQAGHVGVWTKADSVTVFDDLHVEALSQ